MQKAVYILNYVLNKILAHLIKIWFTSAAAFCTVKRPLFSDTRSPPIISSTVSLSLPPSPLVPSLFFRVCLPLLLLTPSRPARLPHLHSFPPPFSPFFHQKSPGHQSYVVSGPSEVHSLLHLAQLPLADPQGPGADTAAALAGPLPLLNPRLPGQEDAGGLTRR